MFKDHTATIEPEYDFFGDIAGYMVYDEIGAPCTADAFETVALAEEWARDMKFREIVINI